MPVPLEYTIERRKEIQKSKKDKKGKEEEEFLSQPDVPMIARKPGVEVFWNERLIKEAHIPLMQAYNIIIIKCVN